MKKPNKFNTFISAIMREACRFSLVEVCHNFGISEKEMVDCETWLDELQKIDEI